MVSEEWAYFNVQDKPEAETFILNEILKHQSKKEGFIIEKFCYKYGLNKPEAEAIKQWQAHGRKPEYHIINTMINHLEVFLADEYNRALQIYYNYVCSFITNKDVAE